MISYMSSMDTAHPVGRQGGLFIFYAYFSYRERKLTLQSSSQKTSIRLIIPMNIVIISYAVMGATSFLCIPANQL